MPDTNASFAGSIPTNFETYLGPLLFEFTAADMALRVTAALSGSTRILEMACGTGISTCHIAHALAPGSEIVATDLNMAMLDHAQVVNDELLALRMCKPTRLTFYLKALSLMLLYVNLASCFFSDQGKGMAEMARVLKPGGALA